MGLSDYDRKRVEDLLHGKGDWFTAKLLRLIAKADGQNLERLRRAFPLEVEAVEAYWGSGAAPSWEDLEGAWPKFLREQPVEVLVSEALIQLSDMRSAAESTPSAVHVDAAMDCLEAVLGRWRACPHLDWGPDPNSDDTDVVYCHDCKQNVPIDQVPHRLAGKAE